MLQVLAAFIVYGPLQLVIQSHCLLTCRYIALSSTVLPVLKCSECRYHSRPQRPRLVWSVPRIATSGKVQHRQSAIHELPVTLCMLRVKSDKSDWLKVRKKISEHAQKFGSGGAHHKEGGLWGREMSRYVSLTE